MPVTKFVVGQVVNVRLSNGYRTEGRVVRAYKNGSYGVREVQRGRVVDAGRVRYHVRFASELRAV